MTSRQYVLDVLSQYAHLPDTPDRPRRQDRALAVELYRQQVPLEKIRAAFLIGSARRLLRPQHLPPLAAIRSLHYFLPILDELQHEPIDPGYLAYVEAKLHQAATRRNA